MSKAMKHGHTKLIVCLRVRHVSDTKSYVSYLKNIIFRLGHASDTIEYGSDKRRMQLERTSEQLDIARIQLEHNLILFSNYLWIKKEFKGPKI